MGRSYDSQFLIDIKRDWTLVDGIKRAKIAVAAGTGQAELVAAVTGKKIRILAMILVAGADTTVTLQSASTALTGAIDETNLGSAGNWAFNPLGWCETAAGEALNALRGASTSLNGLIVYVEV